MNRSAVFVACILGTLAAALALRLPQLNLRPMHVDEAVHAFKFDTLWHTGRYEYDLNEYHGPTLYYAALPSVWLSGARDLSQTDAATFRIVTVVLGVGLILLLLLVADGLGQPATICAGVLTATSPAMTYYSRYYIQETLLVFFTFLALAAGWRYVRSRRVGWALLAGAAVGLMHATKETCVIALGCAVTALAITLVTRRKDVAPQPCRAIFRPWALGAATLVAVATSVVLFSGFLTHMQGPLDSVRAFGNYFQRAGEGGRHIHPWYYYLHILTYWRAGAGPVWSEGLIVGLSLIGMVVALRGKPGIGGHTSLLRFLALYTIFMIVAYSAIPYKTPWCLLCALHGMILLAGFGAVTLYRVIRPTALKWVVAAVLIVACGQLAWQAERGSSLKYCNNERNPYVYAQTLYGVVDLAHELDELAQVHPDGRRMLIKVIVDNCWPLPWYLRGFARVGYWETVPAAPDADVILASSKLQTELEPRLKDVYDVSNCGLRRDERLLVYVRRDLRDALTAHLRSSGATSTQPVRE